MALSKAFISSHLKMTRERRLNRALLVHMRLQENRLADGDIVDVPLLNYADKLHEFFYTCVPSEEFREYVKRVHDGSGFPNWLCGRAGVDYPFS